jgi:hypothetical protein
MMAKELHVTSRFNSPATCRSIYILETAYIPTSKCISGSRFRYIKYVVNFIKINRYALLLAIVED